jgi:carboxylesterase type B
VWRPLIDGDVIPDSPYKLLAEGKFAHKPFINGQNKDEATLFVDWQINSPQGLRDMFDKVYPRRLDDATFAAILEKYPNDPALGAPFNTGSRTFLKSPIFKQAAAMGTDILFTARRRDFLRKANQAGHTKTWGYHFEGDIPIAPDFLGVGHAYDLTYMWGIVKPLLLFWSFDDLRMSENMMDYWTTFAHNLDTPPTRTSCSSAPAPSRSSRTTSARTALPSSTTRPAPRPSRSSVVCHVLYIPKLLVRRCTECRQRVWCVH